MSAHPSWIVTVFLYLGGWKAGEMCGSAIAWGVKFVASHRFAPSSSTGVTKT